MARTLFLGLGNTLLSDDGAGVHALRYLQARASDDPTVEYLDGGTLSFTLLPAIEDASCLIVLDATQMDAEPGTVQCFQGSELDNLLNRPRRSVHEICLSDLLSSARLTGSLPPQRALIGVQPDTLAWGDAPSPQIASAIPWMAEIALECHRTWNEHGASDDHEPVASDPPELPARDRF
jgi:hydrogenase maturation protease